uniref:Uncharacterized protein n=1 Tax=uncultured bacterium contig00094 TaxID=1181565 RepID=A0A806K295_9BACT|nr:hypothetical protein [uncultured bacterium contig00094]
MFTIQASVKKVKYINEKKALDSDIAASFGHFPRYCPEHSFQAFYNIQNN